MKIYLWLSVCLFELFLLKIDQHYELFSADELSFYFSVCLIFNHLGWIVDFKFFFVFGVNCETSGLFLPSVTCWLTKSIYLGWGIHLLHQIRYFFKSKTKLNQTEIKPLTDTMVVANCSTLVTSWVLKSMYLTLALTGGSLPSLLLNRLHCSGQKKIWVQNHLVNS